MQDRVWNIRNTQVTKESPWGAQVAIYQRVCRADGLPIWHLEGTVGPVFEGVHRTGRGDWRAGKSAIEGAREQLMAYAHQTALPRKDSARHGGLALSPGDVFAPEEETLWRLGNLRAKLVIATTSGGRVQIGLALRPKGHWIFVRAIGTVSYKQVRTLATQTRLGWEQIDTMPRKVGSKIKDFR